MNTFIMIYLTQTDGEIFIEEFKTMAELLHKANKLKLHSSDYTVIKGRIIKTFDNPYWG